MVTLVQAIHILGDTLSYDYSFEHTDELINALKVLRNSCNGDCAVADSFIAYAAVDLIMRLCHRIVIDRALMGASIDRDGDGCYRDHHSIVLLCCQVLANFSASGDKYRDHLFDTTTSNSSVRLSSTVDEDKQPIFEALQYVLSAIVISNNRTALMVFVSMLYNCVHNSTERCRRLCLHREMLCPLLLGIFDKSGLLAVDGIAKNSSRDDELLQWYHMLSYAWCRNGMYSTVFETVQSSRSSSGGAAIHEHRVGGCGPLQSVYVDGVLPTGSVLPTHEQVLFMCTSNLKAHSPDSSNACIVSFLRYYSAASGPAVVTGCVRRPILWRSYRSDASELRDVPEEKRSYAWDISADYCSAALFNRS